MGIFTNIIGALAGPLVTNVVGGIFGLDGEDKKSSDGKPRLVAKPEPPKAFKSREIKDFSPRSFAGDRKDAPIAGAVAALRSISPSERETRYWSAIFADAKRKSEIR